MCYLLFFTFRNTRVEIVTRLKDRGGKCYATTDDDSESYWHFKGKKVVIPKNFGRLWKMGPLIPFPHPSH